MLVNNFDPRSRTLMLSRGEAIRISAEDVACTKGVSMGGVEVKKKPWKHAGSLAKEWRALFGKNHSRIMLSAVAREMLACRDGGA